MNYKSETTINFKGELDSIPKMLKIWSQKYNFKLSETNSNIWIYTRGSNFRASCSFDVRYVPTTVKIEYDEINTQIHCLFHVKSYFYHAMPSDPSRVDEQLELLIAYLQGVFAEKLSL